VSQGVVRERVIGALRDALDHARLKGQLRSAAPATVSLDLPKRPEWGDLATTVAMTLAPSEQRSPEEVARIICDNLEQREAIFDRIEIVRPGFLNMTVKRDLWLEVLREIEEQGDAYGRSDLGHGQRVLVEFVSANPTGPLHVGHGRGAALGNALANLLTASGYQVAREYYVNDSGRQMKLLGASVHARYLQRLGRPASVPEDGYRGDYVERVAAVVQDRLGSSLLDLPADDAERTCTELAYDALMGVIREDLRQLGIAFDSWFTESSLVQSGAVQQALDALRKQGLLFEEDGALWFKSSAFGDEKDRVVRKREGEFTYLAPDIAYHRDKLLRGYDLLVNVWGADHHGYIPRMEAVVQAFGSPRNRLRVVLVQMVNLMRSGRKVEMSKRSGEFVTMREVMDEVGADAAKFFFLMRRSDTHLDFDLELAKQRSADNPVYYVQYAHARISSLFRVAAERGIGVPAPDGADLQELTDADEFRLIRQLSVYPTVVQASAEALEPHRITGYLQELAGLLHTFYFKHRILPVADVDTPETADPAGFKAECSPSRRHEPLTPARTAARLVLMREVQRVIRNGLGLLGIAAPERM
jgi:arginyl-tRNA synthetase